MSKKPYMKVVKIDPDSCANYTAREILQMAIDDIDSGAVETNRIVILTDESRYFGGFINGYERHGFLSWKLLTDD